MNEILRSELIMQLICEDFVEDDLPYELDKILTEEESPIKLIGDLDNNKETKKESDALSNEIEDLLNTDELIDRLEEESDEDEFNVNISNNKYNNVDLTLIDTDKEELNIDINNDKNNNDINVNLNNSDKKNINTTITDKDISTSNINLKLFSTNNTSLGNNNINLKLINKDINKDDNNEKSELNINLTNLVANDEESKTDLFIKKRDELIEKANPNMKLSVCLKIIVDLKKSLEKLLNFIPDEKILVKTKSLLEDLIDSILESSNLLLKDEDRLKNMIYKVFDTVISINNYITDHYMRLEDKIDKQNKPSEDKQISKQLNNVEFNQLFNNKPSFNSSFDSNNTNDNDINSNINNNNNFNKPINIPNINRQKI